MLEDWRGGLTGGVAGIGGVVSGIGGVVVVLSVVGLDKLKLDDPVGAISVHGTAGIWGIFAVLLSNDEATFMGQLIGAAATFAWMFIASFIVLFIIKKVIGIRVSEHEEMVGMDVEECGMSAYPEFVPPKD